LLSSTPCVELITLPSPSLGAYVTNQMARTDALIDGCC
jgi:hypothetical protein